MSYHWFDVSKEGLAKQLELRGKSWVLFELIQNALDEKSSRVTVELESLAGDGRVGRARLLVVDDSPDGFKDIRHAYTMFAESPKKANPEARGRFDLGEKLVLAVCDEAAIVSVNDAVLFDRDGQRRKGRRRTDSGTRFEATVRMTKPEIEDATRDVFLLLPPQHIVVTFNGTVISSRATRQAFEATLPTIIGDADGYLRSSARKTVVELYDPLPGETPMLYEMGIPVVESDMPYHVNVRQRVPLNRDRDNVTYAYRRQLGAAVLNAGHESLTEETAAGTWVRTALEDKSVEPETTRAVVRALYGEGAVTASPIDPEANNRAIAAGRHIIYSSAFSREAWENVRAHGAAPASTVEFPTPKPFSDDPDAPRAKVIPRSDWTPDMVQVVALFERLGKAVFGKAIKVTIVDRMNASAAFGGSLHLYLGLAGLGGPQWFTDWEARIDKIVDLAIHEFAHGFVSNHLSQAYYDTLTRLGGLCVRLALTQPDLFRPIPKP